jgi:alpha-mannosidase
MSSSSSSSSSSLPDFLEADAFDSRWVHQQQPKFMTVERAEKFISPVYWSKVNLYSRLYASAKLPLSELVVYSLDAHKQCSFGEAKARLSLPDARQAQVGQSFGPTWSTHWFRVEFRIDSQFLSARECEALEVHLLWDSNSEAMVYDVDGNQVQGLLGGNGDDQRRECIVYRDDVPALCLVNDDVTSQSQSAATATLTLYVEMCATEMFGAGEGGQIQPPSHDRQFELATAELALFDRRAFELLYDFDVMIGLAKHLPDESVRGRQALVAVNAMVNECVVADRSTWPRAAAIARRFFAERNGDAQTTVSCVGNSHLDLAWLWRYQETRRKSARTFASQLRLMLDPCYEQFYRFCMTQAQMFDWLRRDQPALFERVRAQCRAGRFVALGGTWVESDANIPCGESLCRQFLYGQRFYARYFGAPSSVFMLPDTFGYCVQAPQIMRLAGIRYFLTQKLSWSLFNKVPHSSFVWQGLDGSKVLAHFPPADTYVAKVSVDEVLRSATKNRSIERSPHSLMLAGFGDGGGGPTAMHLERAKRLANVEGVPRVSMCSPTEFFERLHRDMRQPLVWSGELYLELHRGTYTTHALVKQRNRRCEMLLADVELLRTLCAANGWLSYPAADIERIYKLLLLNQFHDCLPGTSIELAMQDVHAYFVETLDVGARMLRDAIAALASQRRDIGDDDDLIVVNTTGWQRAEVVQVDKVVDDDKKELGGNGNALALVTAEPCGITHAPRVTLLPNELSARVQVADGGNSFVLSNGIVTCTLDTLGRVTSLRSTNAGNGDVEAIRANSPANTFVMFEDVPLFWDAWDVEAWHLEKRCQLPRASSTAPRVIESNALRCCVEFHTELSAHSHIVQRISLSAHSPHVDFDTVVEWRETHKVLKIAWPLAVHADSARFDAPFGLVQRATHRNNSWDVAKFEVCGHQWVDISEHGFGVALLNDCKYGFAALGHVLTMSLLRSPKAPDANADMGTHHFRYAIYPHGDFSKANVVRAARCFNRPLRCTSPSSSPSSPSSASSSSTPTMNRWICVDRADQVILDTVKWAEPPMICDDGSDVDAVVDESAAPRAIILRLFEALGGRTCYAIDTHLHIESVQAVNILEQPIGDESNVELVSPHRIRARIEPFKVQTFKLFLSGSSQSLPSKRSRQVHDEEEAAKKSSRTG